ncbi:MAG TPA: hypothetical protein VMJ11_12455 [Paraburkholderia sp.]|uniref:hypothetical protein n=1 Tax=Paraburkholderia sp. TaxID=1926495 RepID=UPI002B8DE4C2|nr:hypothetical protein [Paraburkholderia sp.]HTR07438.1 hypothetical protein [Paraburkholderia sp.]
MNRQTYWRISAAAVVALACLPAWGDSLSGHVLDLATNDGLAGVLVSVRTFDGKELATGGTDLHGAYSIALPPDHPLPLVVAFRKVTYVSDPTRVPVKQTSEAQKDVYLAKKDDGDQHYYEKVAQSLGNETDEAQRWQKLQTVAALPAANQSLVAGQLQLSGNTAALNDLATTNKTNQVLARFRENLRDENQPEIAALPDYKSKQIVILSTAPATTNYAVVQDLLNQAKREAALEPNSKVLTLDKGSISDFYKTQEAIYQNQKPDADNHKPISQEHKAQKFR